MLTVDRYNFPSSCRITPDHIYFLPIEESSGDSRIYLCGLDDFIQQNIGSIHYIQFSEGNQFQEGKSIFSIESDKWLGHFLAPFSIKVFQKNFELINRPSLINEDCYGKGWISKVLLNPDSEKQFNNLFHYEKLLTWIEREIKSENFNS